MTRPLNTSEAYTLPEALAMARDPEYSAQVQALLETIGKRAKEMTESQFSPFINRLNIIIDRMRRGSYTLDEMKEALQIFLRDIGEYEVKPITVPEPNQKEDALFSAIDKDLEPFRKRIDRIMQIGDRDLMVEKLKALKDEWYQIAKDITADTDAEKAFYNLLTDRLQAGYNKTVKTTGRPA